MANQPSFLFESSPILLDGGLGTTLEDYLGLDISQSPLWSAQPIVHAREEIIQAHLLFHRAGARIISTSTYQSSFETFQAAGYDSDQARKFMLDSVRVADKARSIFQDEMTRDGRPLSEAPCIALSLGPYGAILKPTQEFRGMYPPPYGPQEYSASHATTNSFDPDDGVREKCAVNALKEFHYTRLMVFASQPDIWKTIDCLAFETVPLKREVAAIREAVRLLQEYLTKEGRGRELKPWWISCVFPEGQSPGETSPGGPKTPIDDLLAAAFEDNTLSKSPLPVPSGFGINCTKSQYLLTLATSIAQFMKALPMIQKPWITIYPNGDDTYDEETRTWLGTTCKDSHNKWSEELAGLVKALMEDENHGFGGIVIGGCCKTGPDHISSLHSILHHNSLVALGVSLERAG